MAHARPTADPVAAVRQYIDAFNKGDVKAMAAYFCRSWNDSSTDFALHAWHGPYSVPGLVSGTCWSQENTKARQTTRS